MFKDKTVLITGGTGSFGQRLTRILLEEHGPGRIRIFSRGEELQDRMRKNFTDESLRWFIGDVRDAERVEEAARGADVIVHAAALKQVPACEYNPWEAVLTNVVGAENVVKAAKRLKVPRVILISTDKAVHPVNIYGATKMMAEKIAIQGNVGQGHTHFSAVRYGNVMGSRGSVLPLFLRQKEQGELTITDFRMTRFWITLDQGVQLVINSLRRMRGGEIFIPKIPSMKVTDLGRTVAPDATQRATGIRPGEKMHECLITVEEARHALDLADCYVIEPETPLWPYEPHDGEPLEEEFSLTSDNNPCWLDEPGLRKMVADYLEKRNV